MASPLDTTGLFKPQTHLLSGAVESRLKGDGWKLIGRFLIEEPRFTYSIDVEAAAHWAFSLYAWVSLLQGGIVLRIGKTQDPLRIRLEDYKRSLNHSMSGRLGSGEHFKGDTQPWEREGWIAYASAPDGGLIFAQQISPADPRTLAIAERAFISDYDPPLSGVSRAGRANKKRWEIANGSTAPISKRPK